MRTLKPLILRGWEVDELTGKGKSSRYDRQNPESPHYDPTWPLPIKLSARSVGYLASEIEAWLASRPRIRVITQEQETTEIEARSASRPRARVAKNTEER